MGSFHSPLNGPITGLEFEFENETSLIFRGMEEEMKLPHVAHGASYGAAGRGKNK